jgi:hypothetical protein
MKMFTLLFAVFMPWLLAAQSLTGSWQLVKQSNCLEEHLSDEDDASDSLVQEVKSRSDKISKVVRFSDHQNGEESTKILNTRKGANAKHFLYKFDGANLYILDKRSRTLTDTYVVETFEGDKLILSNASRPCETMVFVRIKS